MPILTEDPRAGSTLALLLPAVDDLERFLRVQPGFGETMLVVESASAFLKRAGLSRLALASATTLGEVGPAGSASLLGALVAALLMARHQRLVVLAADQIDAVPAAALEQLAGVLATEAVDAVLPAGAGDSRGFSPGGYRRSCLRPLERALARGRDLPGAALKGLRVKWI